MKECDILGGGSKRTLTLLHIFRGSGPPQPQCSMPWLHSRPTQVTWDSGVS